jgi:DNA-binding IclR family transcriptional regulator
VLDASNRVVGALSVSGPATRMSEERMLRGVVPAVISASELLSRELGASPQ